mmetsp:Transcript_7190/g.28279  ORF Transcript_7190/g.28279 Transcript_7190/m.28279 type:complete len:209 (-) Transcript_7190:429-1055(-)
MTMPQKRMETMPTSSNASAAMYAIHGKSATTEASSTAPRTASSGSPIPTEEDAFSSLSPFSSLAPERPEFLCPSPPPLRLNLLKNSADARPVPTPMAVLPTNTLANVPPTRASADAENVSPIPENARYKTTATASLSTDSPNTTAKRFSSTPRSVNIARTLTGSVAPMMLPNIMAFENLNECDTPTAPSANMPRPNDAAPSRVPGKAK